METSIAEAVLLPWWKIVIYIASLVLAVITITFNLNDWLEERKQATRLRDRQKASSKCQHIWTLYADNPYSRCDKCLTLISTGILLTARAYLNPKPFISGEMRGMMMKPGKNEMVTTNYMGVSD